MKGMGNCELCQRAPAVASLRRSGQGRICLKCIRLAAEALPRIWARFGPARQAAAPFETIEIKNEPSWDEFVAIFGGFRAALDTALLRGIRGPQETLAWADGAG
jgi:hypothetical protein